MLRLRVFGLFVTLTPTPKSRRGRDGLRHATAQHEAAIPANHRLDQVVSIPPPPLASPATTTPSSTAVVVFGGVTPSSLSPRNNHGWSVPLGVHRITCMPPGLAVTIDVHRWSNVVKRKIIRKSLVSQEVVVGGGNNNDAATSTSNRLKKMKRNHGRNKEGGGGFQDRHGRDNARSNPAAGIVRGGHGNEGPRRPR